MTPMESLATTTDAEIRTLLTCLGDSMREASSLGPRKGMVPAEREERDARRRLLVREIKMLRVALERIACSMSRYGDKGSGA